MKKGYKFRGYIKTFNDKYIHILHGESSIIGGFSDELHCNLDNVHWFNISSKEIADYCAKNNCVLEEYIEKTPNLFNIDDL